MQRNNAPAMIRLVIGICLIGGGTQLRGQESDVYGHDPLLDAAGGCLHSACCGGCECYGDSGCCDSGCCDCYDCQCCCPSPCGWYVIGEYLHWNASRNNTPFAGTFVPITGTAIDPLSHGTNLFETEFDRDSGYRFSLGYVTPSCWELSFAYTGFETNGASSVGTPNPQADLDNINLVLLDRNIPISMNANDDLENGLGEFASQRLSLDYDVYDMAISRWFDGACGLRFQVFGGLRYSTIDQTDLVVYQDQDGSSIDTYTADMAVNMDAWGLRAGGTAFWGLGCTNLHVFAKSAISLLYADFDLRRTDSLFDPNNQVAAPTARTQIRDYRQSFNQVVPVLDLALGLRWERCGFSSGPGMSSRIGSTPISSFSSAAMTSTTLLPETAAPAPPARWPSPAT